MPDLEPLAIFMSIFRFVPGMVFIIVMTIMFFSLKVTINNDDVQRFGFELSDAVSGTGLAVDRAVFSADQLNRVEQQNKDVEFYARSCDFGYSLEVQSINEKTYCSADSDCRYFCDSVCGIGSDCRCYSSEICQCKKNDQWLTRYDWKLGYTPTDRTKLKPATIQKFPAGISVNGNVIAANMIVSSSDSFMTRLSCITQKAFETKQTYTIFVNKDLFKGGGTSVVFRRTDPHGTHACLYDNDEPFECRYMPNVPFEDLTINSADLTQFAKITAYPLKSDTDCDIDEEAIAGKDDTVTNVLLCLEK